MVIDFGAAKKRLREDDEVTGFDTEVDAQARAHLARRLEKLEAQQFDRIQAVAHQKAELDASVDRAQVEIMNLRAQLEEGQ